MTDHEKTELDLSAANLDTLFAAEIHIHRIMPTHLLQSVVADAEAVQTMVGAGTKIAPMRPRWSFRRDVWDAFGGWRSAAALSACLMIGFSFGYSPSTTLGALAETVLSASGAGDRAFSIGYTLDDMQAEG